MKLYNLKIEGFRRHICTDVFFSDATFLIGENNIGKSSVLAALNYLLNDTKTIPHEEFFHEKDSEGNNKRFADKIMLTAEFRNVPEEAKDWTGFKGRVLPYEKEEESLETGLRVVYRKTFGVSGDNKVELKEHRRTKKACFDQCQTLSEYITAGLDEELVNSLFDGENRTKKVAGKILTMLNQQEELYDFDETEETWFENPGGIPGNVLCRMPKFLLIPAQDKTEELSGNSGTLVSTLNELFNDVRDGSDNYRQAQSYLDKLALELDPSNQESEFGKMMTELNDVLVEVFPESGICAETQLSDSNKVIKPQFKVTMQSNIKTPVALQGTGMVRAAVFALLRYKNIRDCKKTQREGSIIRPIIIGFEEPEIYLHPNAAQQMRDTIYDLASSDINQIVCTTHSPYMIDLSQKPSQTLNNLSICKVDLIYEEVKYKVNTVSSYPFNTSKAFKDLQEDDKTYVKMLLKIDDYLAKVFFAKKILIVEGDTEDIVLRETIKRMPEVVRKDIQANWEIVKARGKAAIISLVKYLKCMGLEPIVMHDEDGDVPKAVIFNKPIIDALGIPQNRHMLQNCIEDILGYEAPSKDKPYVAYKYIKDNWGEEWESINPRWKEIVETIFNEPFELVNGNATTIDMAAIGMDDIAN